MTIFDQSRNIVATADVDFRAGRYSGRVNIDGMQHTLRLMFEEYEEIVNDRVFGLLDQIEDRIGAIPFVAIFDDGREATVHDLQLFPKGAAVAFRVVEPVEVDCRRQVELSMQSL